MPLVRVDVPKGKPADYRRSIGNENWSFGNGEAQYAQ
jgi:hypothetical protein